MVTLDIDRSIPTRNITAPEEVIVGEKLEVSIIVKDLDGIQGAECTFIIHDKSQREVFSLSKEVQVMDDQEGIVSFQYPTPKVNSSVNQPPWQISAYCIDSDGDRGEVVLSHLVVAIQPPECVIGVDCEPEEESDEIEKVSSGFSTQDTILGIGVGLIIIIIVMLSFMIRRKGVEDEYDPWSQNRSEDEAVNESEVAHNREILQQPLDQEPVQEQEIEGDFSEVLDDII